MISYQKLSQARRKLVRALHRKKGRDQEGAYLAEGERLLSELARTPDLIHFLFGVPERMEGLAREFPGVPLFELEGDGADLFATEQAQGVGAVVAMPPYARLADLAAAGEPILYLDRIADPGNAGTILRTAEWFGLHGVCFGAGSADPYNPKVVRASMGAIFRMAIAEDVGAGEIASLGLPVLALDAGGSETLGAMELPRHAVYAVGSEAHGISGELLAVARPIAIRGHGEVDSLNAAIAAGILLYELRRG